MKSIYPTLLLLLLAITFHPGCSSDESQAQKNDTSTTTDTLPPQPGLTRFTPDANYTATSEIISQYGPSGIIRDVVIDQNGILWLAAWDGIVSFDPSTAPGTGSKQFTNHTLQDGLSHHRVYSVMEDSKGNMWFGTLGAGAYKYNGTQFTNLSTNNGMVNNVVNDLFEDAQGNIWFATPKGVSRYDGKTFTNLDSTNGLNQEVYAISQDTYGTMWFGGEAGLFQYNPSGKDTVVTEILTEQGTSYANVRDICYSKGTMYFGAARGFYVSKPLSHVPLKITALNNKFTGYVTADNSGNLLLTSDGIFRYTVVAPSPSDADYDRYTTIVADKSSLGIFGAREAKDGTIWYGAMDGLHSVRDGKDVSYKKP